MYVLDHIGIGGPLVAHFPPNVDFDDGSNFGKHGKQIRPIDYGRVLSHTPPSTSPQKSKISVIKTLHARQLAMKFYFFPKTKQRKQTKNTKCSEAQL